MIEGMERDNAELLQLIYENISRARESERNEILAIIASNKWRGKRQLLEILNGKNRRPSSTHR